jgi:hypothetical protein
VRMRLSVAGAMVLLQIGLLALTPGLAAAAGHAGAKSGPKCHSGYVAESRYVTKRVHGKPVRVREVSCVMATSTAVAVWEEVVGYLAVSGSVAHEGKNIVGETITYTIEDETTDRGVATFSARAPVTCTIRSVLEGQRWTFEGEAHSPYQACPLGQVSMPAADHPALVGAFAGSAIYAPSLSEAVLF